MQRCHLLYILLYVLTAIANPVQAEDYHYTRSDGRKATIALRAKKDSTWVIEHRVGRKKVSEWVLKHPVFHFCCGDMTGDSIPEIAVGVVKKTRYSQVEAPRLFLFKLFEEELIRPLWLSSRLCGLLQDFSIEPDGSLLTKETKPDGSTIRVRYRTAGFGLKVITVDD